MVRVAAYQAQQPFASIPAQVDRAIEVLKQADQQGIDIVCFPEAFLSGYHANPLLALQYSLDPASAMFAKILEAFSPYSATAILGFNEKTAGHLYNTFAVIEKGEVVGLQRKHFLYHDYFTPGSEFAPITVKGIPIGLIICLDSTYLEPARILALQGAKILCVPMCNRVPLDHPYAQRPDRYHHFIARAHENNCLLVAADWAMESDGETTCAGHTCIYDGEGNELARTRDGEELIIIDFDLDTLSKTRRVTGSPSLNDQLANLLCSD